jgi:serine/threonine protein kinase
MAHDPSTIDHQPEDRLPEAIASFEEARDAGVNPESAEWLARYPEVAAELAAYFAAQQALREVAGTLVAPGDPAEPFPEIRDYESLEEIGRGGMGAVYKARQVSLNRIVALKVVRADKLADLSEEQRREWLTRFRQEAEAVADLDHANIVPIYEAGEHGGRLFFSMKYVEGGSLKDGLERYAADPKAAARLVEEAARAVHHAHQRGILHRDLKPGNFLLDGEGRPHVTDFGLAKRFESGPEAATACELYPTRIGLAHPHRTTETPSSTGSSSDACGVC